MTAYISNAFALSMVPEGATIRTKVVDLPSIAKRLNNTVSVVGHADTAKVFESLLGIPIAHNRVTINLTDKDTLYVGQLIGGRLPEGVITLPKGFAIKWICVRIDADSKPLEAWWTRGGSSVYGAIDRAAEEVANLVNGKVTLNQDPWGNPHWEVNGHGFYGNLWDD